MDSGRLHTVSKPTLAPALADADDALAAYARDWPELASALVGGKDVGDGAAYRATLLEHLDRFLREQSTGPELDEMVVAMRAIMSHHSADRFKLALAADARKATAERLASGHVHTLWGVTPVINLIPLSAAARRLNVVADTFCYRPYHVTSAFDVSLARHWDVVIKGDYTAYTWLAFSWAMLRYDIFHTFFDAGLLQPTGQYGSPNFGVNLEEMQLLRAGGKRLYCFAYGADNRTRNRTLAVDPINFCMHCPSPGRFCVCSDENAAQMMATIDQYTTANIASGLSTDYVPNCYEMQYLIADTDAIEASPIEIDEVEPIRILHAPNHPHFKGSHYLMDAVDELRREGVAIELELISGVQQTDVVAAMRRAHVVADQFISGFYGQTAIEAMALGRPVLCYLRDNDRRRAASPEELPIISCHPRRIKEDLRQLVANRAQLPEIGGRSRQYVERHHSLQMFAHRLRTLYEETAELPPSVVLAEAPPPSFEGHSVKLLNETAGATMRAARNRMREDMAALVALTGRASWDAAATARREMARALKAEKEALVAEAREHALAAESKSKEATQLREAAGQLLHDAEASARRLEQSAREAELTLEQTLQRQTAAEESVRAAELRAADIHAQAEEKARRAQHAQTAAEEAALEAITKMAAAAQTVRDAEAKLKSAHDAYATAEQRLAEIEHKSVEAELAYRDAEARVAAILADANSEAESLVEQVRAKLEHTTAQEQAALKARAEADSLLETALKAEEHIRLVEQARADQTIRDAKVELNVVKAQATRAVLEAEQALRTGRANAADQLERMQLELRTGLERAATEAEHAKRMSHSQAMHGVLAAEQAKREAEERAAQASLEAAQAIRNAQDAVAAMQLGSVEPGSPLEAIVLDLRGRVEVRREIEALTAQMAAAQAETAALAAAKASADAEISALAAAKSAAEAALASAAAARVEADTAKAAAEAEISALITSKAALQTEAAETAARAGAVAETLRQIEASKAWRITAPLRSLHGILRGKPRRPKSGAVHSEAEPHTIKALAEIQIAKGRPLRVLHVGNPDNLAYTNAKVQRRAGIEADVLCIDDYSATSSPEWAEAEIKGDAQDLSLPDWWRGPPGSFSRPDWFVQGPADATIRYLLTRMDKPRAAVRRLRAVNFERWLLTRRSLLQRMMSSLIRWRTGRKVGEHGMPANAILMQYGGALLTKWSRFVPFFGNRLRAYGLRGLEAGRVAQGLIGAPRTASEIANPYIHTIRGWRHPNLEQLLARYDVVQTYGQASVIPYLAGYTNFLVVENEALSSPTTSVSLERATGVDSHRVARRVLTQEADAHRVAHRLGVDAEKVLALPNAIDSQLLAAFVKRNGPVPPNRMARFFAPARHDRKAGEPDTPAAIDRIIQALAIVRAAGRSCRVDMIAWGLDVEATRACARALGVADMIVWHRPMPKLRLWREYLRCDAVMGDFATSTMVQASAEAMFLGRRVIVRMDPTSAEALFGEPPPLHACESAEEIARAMIRVIDDPTDAAGSGRANAHWARRIYGLGRVVERQVSVYQEACAIGGQSATARKGKSRLLTFGVRSVAPDGKPLSPYRAARSIASRALTGFVVKHADSVLDRAMRAGTKASARRQRSGRMRSLWGVTPILTLPLLARCDALLGLRSRTLVFVTYYISKNFDINLTKMREYFQRDYAVHLAFLKWVMAYTVLRYDVVHYFYDRGIMMPPNGRIMIAPKELEILKATGKRIYTYAYGADVRTRETTLGLGKYNFCADCDTPRRYCICSEEEARQNVDVIRQYANAMVSMIDMIHYVPGCRNMHYWPMDVDKVRYVGTKWDGQRPLRLLHAPNHMHFKGSRHLLAAVEQLQAEGVPIELKTISGVPNTEVLRCMAEADIVAEQFIGGAYGYTAVEAWAMGKPVLTYVRDDSVPASAQDFPGINTNPDDLYDVLKSVVAGSHDLQDVGRRSRRYVERYYSIEGVALGLGRMYLETGNLNEKMRARIASRIGRIEAARDRRLAQPLTDEASIVSTRRSSRRTSSPHGRVGSVAEGT